ncbi:MAG TPA: tryptophan synthase subunit beta [Candidatus Dojkabacteria bacterium]|nr:tryptophan synthase subunit beta [Candidatus Dojkabacteria bacterium]HRP51783.1 tryptophan synthase subunit beta [Candidatus Dojkabacteria bacterium]
MKNLNKKGKFGEFGGMFVPKDLEQTLTELAEVYEKLAVDDDFINELRDAYKKIANRPSPLYFAQNMTDDLSGPKIYLKREDLNHTGAHKINNVIGQGLIAKRLGKKKLIAETGAGQHGVATATIAAYLNMDCDIYMGARDIDAQKPNVYRMKILGANVIPVTQGQGTLKDAVDVALENFIKDHKSTHYLLGSVVGPHPYPTMVRDFQKIVGEEISEQLNSFGIAKPRAIIACVGGGSNAIGAMYEFINDEEVELIAVEPAGKGKNSGKHGLSLGTGKSSVIHGFRTLTLLDEKGEIRESYSAASGLDYPGVGPELSMLKENGRLKLGEVTDQEAVEAFAYLSKKEGIIPALESAHAIAYILKNPSQFSKDDVIVINLSGRGDKDVENVYENYM